MPPLVGVAVNVTLVPAQILVCDAIAETDGIRAGLTTMFTVFDVAVPGEAQVSDDVITHVTKSPLLSEVLE